MANTAYIPQPNTPLPRKRWFARWWGMLLIILCLFVLASGAWFGWQVKHAYDEIRAQALQVFDTAAAVDRFRTPGPYADFAATERPWTGTDTPKVTIVEFLDFNCPVCRASYPTIREIVGKHQNDIRLVMRHFPIIAESSLTLALAGECAHEQGLFWNLHDRFFQNTNPAENIGSIARQTGLNMSQFNSCMQERRHEDLITRDQEAAVAIGARGTPTWLINGHRIDGQIPHDTFIQLIDSLTKDDEDNKNPKS